MDAEVAHKPSLLRALRTRHNLLLDITLFLGAAVLPFHPVFSWLDGHRDVLYWAAGSAHLVCVPLMLVQQICGSSRSGAVVLSNERSPLAKAMVWVTVLFFGTSFIVPVVFSLGVVHGPSLGGMMLFLFGPYVLLVAGIALVLRLERRVGYHRVTELFAAPWLAWATTLLGGAYLALTETVLFVAAASGGVWGGGMAFGAAFLSYLPVRLFVFFFRSTDKAELALLCVTFGHLLLRLALAGP